MLRAPRLVLAATLATTPACGRDAYVHATLTDARALSDAIVSTVHDADDPAQGIAAARALLDERRPDLARDIAEVRAIRSWRMRDATEQRIAPELLAALEPVEALRDELAAAAANDPALDAALRGLVADYARTLMAEKRE